MNAPLRKTTEVAVGVLIRPDGRVLLADRPEGKPYAGYWEFPGGKIESGESVAAALTRELREEIGIEIASATPWVTLEYDYPHAYVRLHFCRVYAWQGEAQGREGQRLDFFHPAEKLPKPLLPAAVAPLKWLNLPEVYALTQIGTRHFEEFWPRCEQALQRGLRLVQLREPGLGEIEACEVFSVLRPRLRTAQVSLLVNGRHPRELWTLADGVHLTAKHLMKMETRDDLPAVCSWIGASVHNRNELEHAARIGCDFVVAGPVLATASHPVAQPLGWEGFAALIHDTPLPVYALGGLTPADVARAQAAGAHGVALLSAAWPRE